MSKNPAQNLRLVELCKRAIEKRIGACGKCSGGCFNALRNNFIVARQLGTQKIVLLKPYVVQVLPVFEKPVSEGPFAKNGEILLCQWKDGWVKDRYTGLMLSYLVPRGAENDKIELIEEELNDVALSIIERVKALKGGVSKLTLVGKLDFDGPPIHEEYIYKAVLKTEKMETIKSETIDYEGNPCKWFKWDEIPYKEMPADDQLWYPQVLWGDALIEGTFVFGGTNEKQIKAYYLHAVNEFSELCKK